MKTVVILTIFFSFPILLLSGKCSKGKVQKTETFTVIIDTVSFVPETAKVLTGTEVTWINKDHLVVHSVVSGTPDNQDNRFGSNFIRPGESYSFLFTQKGMYPYFCSVHPWFMHGVIEVQ
jgi:plastocyanin